MLALGAREHCVERLAQPLVDHDAVRREELLRLVRTCQREALVDDAQQRRAQRVRPRVDAHRRVGRARGADVDAAHGGVLDRQRHDDDATCGAFDGDRVVLVRPQLAVMEPRDDGGDVRRHGEGLQVQGAQRVRVSAGDERGRCRRCRQRPGRTRDSGGCRQRGHGCGEGRAARHVSHGPHPSSSPVDNAHALAAHLSGGRTKTGRRSRRGHDIVTAASASHRAPPRTRPPGTMASNSQVGAQLAAYL